jgi:glucose dehydrogenase
MQVRFGVQGSVFLSKKVCMAWRTGYDAWGNVGRGTATVFNVVVTLLGTQRRLFDIPDQGRQWAPRWVDTQA